MQVTWIQITATLDADYSHFCMQITAASAADYSHLWTHISAMMQITATLPKAQNYKSSRVPSSEATYIFVHYCIRQRLSSYSYNLSEAKDGSSFFFCQITSNILAAW